MTTELWEEIKNVLSTPNPLIDGYYSRHQYFFWGKPMHGFKPYGLRLFKKGRVTMDRSELVDMRFVVDGKTDVLREYVYEHNMKEWSIDFWIDKHQKFARKLAIEEILRNRGRLRWTVTPSLVGNPDQRVIWLKNAWYNSPLYVRSIFYFGYRYFIRLGFLDGTTGAIFHFLHGLWFRLLVDIHISRMRNDLNNGTLSLDELERIGPTPG